MLTRPQSSLYAHMERQKIRLLPWIPPKFTYRQLSKSPNPLLHALMIHHCPQAIDLSEFIQHPTTEAVSWVIARRKWHDNMCKNIHPDAGAYICEHFRKHHEAYKHHVVILHAHPSDEVAHFIIQKYATHKFWCLSDISNATLAAEITRISPYVYGCAYVASWNLDRAMDSIETMFVAHGIEWYMQTPENSHFMHTLLIDLTKNPHPRALPYARRLFSLQHIQSWNSGYQWTFMRQLCRNHTEAAVVWVFEIAEPIRQGAQWTVEQMRANLVIWLAANPQPAAVEYVRQNLHLLDKADRKLAMDELVCNPAIWVDDMPRAQRDHFRDRVTEQLMARVWHPLNMAKFRDWGVDVDVDADADTDDSE